MVSGCFGSSFWNRNYFTGSLDCDHQSLALYPGFLVCFVFFGLDLVFPRYMFLHVSA